MANSAYDVLGASALTYGLTPQAERLRDSI